LGGQHEYALDETSEKKSSLAYGADEFTAMGTESDSAWYDSICGEW
jgi:hypothetical protein